MRFFHLLGFQDTMAWLFTAAIFLVVFGVGLAYTHLHGQDDEARKKAIIGRYADGIEDRDAPFPLMMMLIIAGTIIWGILYIVLHGLWGVKI
jgi:amino acid permease